MCADVHDQAEDRRAFLRRLACSALGIVGAGALGLAFWDRQGPMPGNGPARGDILPDFSLPGQTGKLAVVHNVADRIRGAKMALNALGGIERFVRPGDHVLLKVNAAFALPPMLCATTHPDMVTQVTRMCLQAGAARVWVTDNPINDPVSCFALTGIDAAARAAGARLILPTRDRFSAYSVPGARLIQRWPALIAPLLQVDKVIGMAPVKDHHRSGASMTLKNWYGLLGGRRNIFHQQIHTIIAELAMMVKPTLVILDGTMSMMHNGPTGGSLDDLKATYTVVAGTDPVAVDAFGCSLLNLTPEDLPHLRMAQEAGAGTVDFESLKPVHVNG
jgi:uncharacterized protein (DUF362 family)